MKKIIILILFSFLLINCSVTKNNEENKVDFKLETFEKQENYSYTISRNKERYILEINMFSEQKEERIITKARLIATRVLKMCNLESERYEERESIEENGLWNTKLIILCRKK